RGPVFPSATGVEPLLELANLREEVLDLDARVLELLSILRGAIMLKMPFQGGERSADRPNGIPHLLGDRAFHHRKFCRVAQGAAATPALISTSKERRHSIFGCTANPRDELEWHMTGIAGGHATRTTRTCD